MEGKGLRRGGEGKYGDRRVCFFGSWVWCGRGRHFLRRGILKVSFKSRSTVMERKGHYNNPVWRLYNPCDLVVLHFHTFLFYVV